MMPSSVLEHIMAEVRVVCFLSEVPVIFVDTAFDICVR